MSKQKRLLRQELPALRAQLATIPDPRDPKKHRHTLTAFLLDGLLMFDFQFASRRATNREMTSPQFLANLGLLLPEIDRLPHAETLFRLLRDIDLTHLEQAHIDLVQRLIRGKCFRHYRIDRYCPIAIDGSQKLAGDTSGRRNARSAPSARRKPLTQYFVYVVEANLAFHNGLVIPLLSEFLENAPGIPRRKRRIANRTPLCARATGSRPCSYACPRPPPKRRALGATTGSRRSNQAPTTSR